MSKGHEGGRTGKKEVPPPPPPLKKVEEYPEVERMREEKERALAKTIKPPTPITKPPIIETKPTEVKVSTSKVLQNIVSRAGKDYENIFRNIIRPLDTAIANIYKASAQSASKGEYGKASILYSTGILAKGARSIYDAYTFPVRPAEWREVAKLITNLLTAEKGESVEEYQNRIKGIVEGDIDDPKLREQYTQQILKTIPEPPRVSDEQRKNAKLYKQALAASIMEDPVGFLAEVAGGYVGGTLFLKTLKKLPGVKNIITVKTLEQRMWDKCTPIDEIKTTVPEVHTPTAEWSASLMPKGTWRTTWEIAKDVVQKGGTAVVMLADPKTGKISSYLTWAEATKITNGLPEAMGAIGTLTAIPVVIKTDELTDTQLKKILKIEPTQDYYEQMKQDRENQLLIITTPKIGELEDQLKETMSKSEIEDLQDRLQDEDEDQAIIVVPTVKTIETPIQPPVEESKPTPKPHPPEQVTETVTETVIEEKPVVEAKPVPKEVPKEKQKALTPGMRGFEEKRQKPRPGEESYTIKFTDYEGRSETHDVSAKTFQEAYAKAFHIRKWHGLLHVVDIQRRGSR